MIIIGHDRALIFIVPNPLGPRSTQAVVSNVEARVRTSAVCFAKYVCACVLQMFERCVGADVSSFRRRGGSLALCVKPVGTSLFL